MARTPNKRINTDAQKRSVILKPYGARVMRKHVRKAQRIVENGSTLSRLVSAVLFALATGFTLLGCVAQEPSAQVVAAKTERMVQELVGPERTVQAGAPEAIACPELNGGGRYAYEVPVQVDGVTRPPMRVARDGGRWINLNGSCTECHVGDTPDFEYSQQPDVGAF